MGKIITVISLILFLRPQLHAQEGHENQRIENLKAFTKLYGYVRWFHPSDEASAISWNRFAAYGAYRVEQLDNSKDLIKVLNELFKPIAPTIKIYSNNDSVKFDISEITPRDLKSYRNTYWQHIGVGLDDDEKDIYQSIRVNRPSKKTKAKTSSTAVATFTLNARPYVGCEFKYRAKVRMSKEYNGLGHLWTRVDKYLDGKNKVGFFENMHRNPIFSDDWSEYEIIGIIDSNAIRIAFGFFLEGKGEMFIDDLMLEVKINNSWVKIYKNDFESSINGKVPDEIYFSEQKDNKYVLSATNISACNSRIGLSIKSKDFYTFDLSRELNKKMFNGVLRPTDYIENALNDSINCIIPLCLFANGATYPVVDNTLLFELIYKINTFWLKGVPDKYMQLSDIVVMWNVLQHFYPYWDIVKVNWHQELDNVYAEYFGDSSKDFSKFLKKFTARIKDGHVYVYNSEVSYFPPICWEWIEGKLIITKVLQEDINLKVGWEVNEINNKRPIDFFEEEAKYISSSTQSWLQHRLKVETLIGYKNTKLEIKVQDFEGNSKKEVLSRDIEEADYYESIQNKNSVLQVSDSIYYINLEVVTERQIDSMLQRLKMAKSIICDLRGYPNDNNFLIKHLMKERDTCAWFEVPLFMYPNQDKGKFERIKVTKYLKPLSPNLKADIIFIVGNGTISWGESYLALVTGYNLAILVGQNTAGTNGDINVVKLPSGHIVNFTGLRANKINGKPIHCAGFQPDIFVNVTYQGVLDKKDEFLEKAIELAKKRK